MCLRHTFFFLWPNRVPRINLPDVNVIFMIFLTNPVSHNYLKRARCKMLSSVCSVLYLWVVNILLQIISRFNMWIFLPYLCTCTLYNILYFILCLLLSLYECTAVGECRCSLNKWINLNKSFYFIPLHFRVHSSPEFILVFRSLFHFRVYFISEFYVISEFIEFI